MNTLVIIIIILIIFCSSSMLMSSSQNQVGEPFLNPYRGDPNDHFADFYPYKNRPYRRFYFDKHRMGRYWR